MRRRSYALIAALTVIIAFAGCGPKTIHTAALISDQFSQALLTAQSAVKTAHDVGAMTDETYLSVQTRFEQMGVVGLSINQALRDGSNQKAIAQVAAALQIVDTILTVDLLKIKPEQRAIIQVALIGLKSTLLAYASVLGGA